MKTRLSLLTFSAALLLAVSCNKADEEEMAGQALSIAEAKVGDDFSWSTAHRVMLNVDIVQPAGCAFSGPKNPTVYVLDKDYNRIRAAVSSNNRAGFDLTLPKIVREVIVYLPETGGMVTVPVTEGNNSARIEVPCVSTPKYAFKDNKDVSANCTQDCGEVVSGAVTSLTIGKKDVVCLTGSLNGPVVFEKGGVLKVCGTANITGLTVKKDGDNSVGLKIIVSETGTLTMPSGLALDGQHDYLINYGQATLASLTLHQNSQAENYNKFTVSGNLKTSLQGSFTNNANLVAGSVTNEGKFTNNSHVTVNGNVFSSQPSADLDNKCLLKVNGDLTINGKFSNSALISANTGNLNSAANFHMNNGAMLNLKNLNWNGTIVKTSGATSMFKVSGNTHIDAHSKVHGSLDLCDANGLEANAATFSDNVKYCQTYIPKNECNDVGAGNPTDPDSDGDGVPDDSDDYPNDPGKAFDSYYPHTGYAINGYEDLWPSRGDYDFNDLVIKYRTHFVQNAANKFVTADFEVLLHAIGAGLHNGLGLQFLERGTGVEKFKRISLPIMTSVSGQADKIEGVNMLKVYNDVFEILTSYYNNVGDGPTRKPDTLRFAVTFNAALTHPSALIPDFYIFRSDDRGHEIHLPDRPATILADPTTWGTYDDNTMPLSYKWYKTDTNQPWGVEIITGTNSWKHPLSKVLISDAYVDFMPWVNSNGASYNDWFTRPTESLVFQGW